MYKLRFAILATAILLPAASSARAQNQYIGYVYPAGGQQGSTFPLRFGGQNLIHASDVIVTGEGRGWWWLLIAAAVTASVVVVMVVTVAEHRSKRPSRKDLWT